MAAASWGAVGAWGAAAAERFWYSASRTFARSG